MLPLADFLAFVWLAGCAAYSLWSLTKGSRQSIHYVVLVHFLFCGVPLALDLWIGPAQYRFSRNLTEASQDETTSLIYAAYVSIAPAIWLAMARSQRRSRGEAAGDSGGALLSQVTLAGGRPWVLPLLYTLMILPIVVAFLAPNPGMYTEYAPIVRADRDPAEVEFQARWVTMASVVSILSCAAAMAIVPRITVAKACLFAACLFQDVWLQGKRFSVALTILIVLFTLWQRGTLRGKHFAAACLLALVTMGSFSYWYQHEVRGRSIGDTPDYYQDYRSDYGRDGVIKQAIHAELHPDEGRILQYRGQSIVYLLTFFVPRTIWPEKPWSYTIYCTAAMLGIPEAYYVGYGMTTSILDESLANFGWLGLLLGPWIVGAICGLGDNSRWPMIRLLTAVIGPLLLVQDMSIYIMVFTAWLALAVYSQPWKRVGEANVAVVGCPRG